MAYRVEPIRRSGRRSQNCFLGCVLGSGGALLAIMVICGLMVFYVGRNRPSAPLPNFTPDPVQAQQFEQIIQGAATQARQSGGGFEVTLSEAQASSWLNLEARRYTGEDVPLENMQISFRDGRARLYGEANVGGLPNVPMQIDVFYSINPDGRVIVNLGGANVGGLGLPESSLNEITRQIQDIIDQELQGISGNYRVMDVSLYDGVLILRGSGQ